MTSNPNNNILSNPDDPLTKKNTVGSPGKKFTKGRHFYITSFQDIDIDAVKADANVVYMLVAEEVAPTTGAKHYHIYGALKKQTYLKALQLLLSKDKSKATELHVEQVLSVQGCVDYCKKEGKVIFEKGTLSLSKRGKVKSGNQGKRTDLDDVADDLKAGVSICSLVASRPKSFIKFSGGILKTKYYLDEAKAKQWRSVEVWIYYGLTGTGKTKAAKEAAGDGGYYILNEPGTNGMLWFDGYDGEKTLIIDDFYGWIKQHQLLRLCDGHPFHCQLKGGYAWASWTKVIFTSNDIPDKWYKKGLSAAFSRRCPQEHWLWYEKLGVAPISVKEMIDNSVIKAANKYVMESHMAHMVNQMPEQFKERRKEMEDEMEKVQEEYKKRDREIDEEFNKENKAPPAILSESVKKRKKNEIKEKAKGVAFAAFNKGKVIEIDSGSESDSDTDKFQEAINEPLTPKTQGAIDKFFDNLPQSQKGNDKDPPSNPFNGSILKP